MPISDENVKIIERYLSDFTPREVSEVKDVFHQTKLGFDALDEKFSVYTFQYVFCKIIKCQQVDFQLEKVRWIIPMYWKSTKCSIYWSKFGIRLHADENSIEQIHSCIVTIFRKISTLIRKSMKKIEPQFHVIPNRYFLLSNMYYNFRFKAEATLTKLEEHSIGDADFYNLRYDFFYYYIAYINSYFSLLEHIFIYILLFDSIKSNPNIDINEVNSFCNKAWKDKFDQLFDFSNTVEKDLYDQLQYVKNTYRNTFSHGGFEAQGKSFQVGHSSLVYSNKYVKSSKIDPITEIFSDPKSIFIQTNKIFDDFIEYLSEDKSIYAMCYLNSAMNFILDNKIMNNLKEKIEAGFDVFEQHTEFLSESYCRFANAE